MNLFIIIGAIAAIAVVLLYFAFKNAPEIKEEEPSFKPRKVTILVSEIEKPKRKKKKYYNKKKKPAVVKNETTEKRPVGRPRKTVE